MIEAVYERPFTELREVYEATSGSSPWLEIPFILRRNGRWWAGNDIGFRVNRDEARICYAWRSSPGDYNNDHLVIAEFLEEVPGGLRNGPKIMPKTKEEVGIQTMHEMFSDDTEHPLCNIPLIVRDRDGGKWILSFGSEVVWTDDRNKAHVFPKFGKTPSSIQYAGCIAEILEQPEIQKPKRINQLFAPDFIELMRMSPKNDMVRGWILKVTKQLPPEECDSFEKYEAWIESLSPASVKVVASDLVLNLTLAKTEEGRCNYSHEQAATVKLELTADEIREIVMHSVEAGSNINGVTDAIEEHVGEVVWDRTDPRWNEVDGSMSHSDYEESDDYDDNRSWDSKGELKKKLREWIKTNMPEQATELGIQ